MVFTLNSEGTPIGQLNFMPGINIRYPWRVDLDKQDDIEGTLKRLVRAKLDNLYVEAKDLQENLKEIVDAKEKKR